MNELTDEKEAGYQLIERIATASKGTLERNAAWNKFYNQMRWDAAAVNALMLAKEILDEKTNRA